MPLHPAQSVSRLEQAVARLESARPPLAAHDALTARLPAAARLVLCLVQERHSAADCLRPVHCAAAARRRLLLPEGQQAPSWSAELPRVARPMMREAAASCRSAAAPERARLSAEAARQARRSAGPAVSAEQAAVLRPGARDAQAAWPRVEHAGAVRQAPRDAVEVPLQAARDAVGAPPDVVEVLQQVAQDAAEARRRAAQGGAEEPRLEAAVRAAVAARDAGVLLRGVPGAQAVPPSAVAWAFRRDQVLPSRPAQPPAARFGRAKESQRIASL